MDPAFVGLTMRPQVYFLARGDVFKKPLAKRVLYSMNILPIFRKEDSLNNHEKNEITYDLCSNLLAKKKFIIIYPEGYCVQEKKLRPLKKGAARLAFHALQKNNWEIDLHILPVGVNYSNPNKFQSDIVIHFGKPIRILDYKNDYLNNPNKVTYNLTRFLEQEMKKLLVIIDNRDLEPFAEQIEILYGKELAYRYGFSLKDKLAVYQMRRAIGQNLNKANEALNIEMADLYADTKRYFNDLNKLNLRDFLLDDGLQRKPVFFKTLLAVLLGFFMWPAFWLNYYVFHLPHKIAKKTTRAIEFYPSVLIGSGAILFTLYFVLISVLAAIFLSKIWIIPCMIILLIGWSFLTIPFYRFIQKLKGAYRFNKLLKINQPMLAALYEQRIKILSELDNFFKRWGFNYPNL
jgi:hypothetical protein